VLVPLAVAFGVCAAFLCAAYFLFRKNLAKAVLLSVALFILFFSYGHIKNILDGIVLLGLDVGRDRHVLGVFGIILATLFFVLYRSRSDLRPIVFFFFRFGVVLLAISLFSVARFAAFSESWSIYDIMSRDYAPVAGTNSNGANPDIYYIILDGYAQESTLRSIYEFDNTSFLKSLRERGFFVPTASRANYAQTHLSLASSLNMDYLPTLPKESTDFSPTFQLIRKNAVSDFLRTRGYRFVHIGSGMVEMTNRNPYADIDFRNGRFDEFTTIALESSAAYPFVRSQIEAQERDRVLYSFNKLKEIPLLGGPNFIFSHIVVPHPPFVFGPNGERIDDPNLRLYENNPWLLKRHYIDQLQFTNKKTLETIDAIIKASKTPSIIILQGDHGTASTGSGYKGLEEPTEILAKERMKIFAAYRLPGHEEAIPEEITPINAFRKIFNAYFDANFSELPNKSYFSHYERPFDFIDVTDDARKSY